MKIQQTLKFRAWDVFYKKFVYSDQDTMSSFWLMVERGLTAGREVPVDRWTGIKDKNGKEIYEGDIVTHPNLPENENETVIFKRGAFGTDFLSFDEMANEHGDEIEQWEVIGNIYENPELLNL